MAFLTSPARPQLDGIELLGHHIVLERTSEGGIPVASSANINKDEILALVKRLLGQASVSSTHIASL